MRAGGSHPDVVLWGFLLARQRESEPRGPPTTHSACALARWPRPLSSPDGLCRAVTGAAARPGRWETTFYAPGVAQAVEGGLAGRELRSGGLPSRYRPGVALRDRASQAEAGPGGLGRFSRSWLVALSAATQLNALSVRGLGDGLRAPRAPNSEAPGTRRTEGERTALAVPSAVPGLSAPCPLTAAPRCPGWGFGGKRRRQGGHLRRRGSEKR